MQRAKIGGYRIAALDSISQNAIMPGDFQFRSRCRSAVRNESSLVAVWRIGIKSLSAISGVIRATREAGLGVFCENQHFSAEQGESLVRPSRIELRC